MSIRNFKPLVALALVAGSLGAIAAPDSGFYAGASIGTPQYPDILNGVSGDGSAASGKVFGGYQVTPNFALEAGVAALGDISQMNGRSEFLDAIGNLPLNEKWSLLGRLGVAHVNLDTSLGNDSGNGMKTGLGVQYSLSSKVALRGEWERYQMNVFGDKPNVDQYTVGLRVGF
ncbi:MAG: outer membrane beta-barrel protein [Rhodoferax sp.]